jgi:hypothetical protein
MNNLYKDLYSKAVEWCVSQGSDEAWSWEKKYAELIVEECISVSPSGDANCNIREHFGLD